MNLPVCEPPPLPAWYVRGVAARSGRLGGPARRGRVRAVVARELISEARNRLTHGLRLVAGGVLVSVLAYVSLGHPARQDQGGYELFRQLTRFLGWTIFVLAPLLTADCLSREKREGTLGLLFLTPLTARDIVLGKSLTHGLRALSMVLAALPIMSLPLMLGGVTLLDALGGIVASLAALLLALAAGLWASVRQTEWLRAIVVAEALSLMAALLWWQLADGFFPSIFFLLLATASAAAILAGTIRRFERRWREDALRPSQPHWVRLFSASPFWQQAFHWNTARTLDRNPMAWLQEYSWTARLTKWVWVLLMLLIGFPLAVGSIMDGGYEPGQTRLASYSLVLCIATAFSAANTFHRERESGALELLLVTPLSVGQIVRGRLWGMLCHFATAATVGLIPVFAAGASSGGLGWASLHAGVVISSLVNVALIGFCLSLMRMHFLLAWLLTCLCGLGLPVVATSVIGPFHSAFGGMIVFALAQSGCGAVACMVLVQNLRQRAFAQ